MEKVKLGDIAKVITKGTTPTSIGYNFENIGINFVKIESISETGEFLKDKFSYISEECNEKLSRSKLIENDILFSIAGAIGRVAIVNKEIIPANTNQALAIIRIDDRYNKNFLKYLLTSDYIKKQYNKKKQGVAQINLSLKDISELEIPIIDVKEQSKIANKLDEIQEIIDIRKRQIEALEELIKSQFVEMFGTIKNSKFNIKTFEEFVKDEKNSIKRGPFGGSLKKEDFVEKGYLVYEQRHAIHNDFKYEKYYISEQKYKEMKMFEVKPGDLLISCSGVTLGRISEVPMNAKKGIINQALLKITLNPSLMNNIFFIYQFRNDEIQEKLFSFSRGSGIPNFPSMTEVKKIGFICPHIELQNKFAEFVKQIDKQKFEIQKSLEEIQKLQETLMNKYFE